MFEGISICFSVYRNYSVVERQQNLISDAVISLLINVHSYTMKIKYINELSMNVMSVDVVPMNKNNGTLFIAERTYFYFIPSV
jgi:hypothetical protein